MADRGATSNEGAKFTRTSAACVACRARKQKCSGERPQCAQCGINQVQCEWPHQQKRGPPKQYISALEARLFETENILAALLTQVSDSQLASGFHRLDLLRQEGFGFPGVRDQADALTYARKNKSGPAYWHEHPLRTPEEVRRWARDRVAGIGTLIEPSQSDTVLDFENAESLRNMSQGQQPNTEVNYEYEDVSLPDNQHGDQALERQEYGSSTGLMEDGTYPVGFGDVDMHSATASASTRPQAQGAAGVGKELASSTAEDIDSAYLW